MANGARIEVQGLDKTLRALKVIDPEAMKAFRRGFKDATQPIVDKAKRRAPGRPMSGWGQWGDRLDWSEQAAKRGIRSAVSVTRTRARLQLKSTNAAAAVYENAGSKSPNSPFVRGLIRSGQADQPRLLVKTWKEEQGIKAVHTQVGRLVEDAINRVASAVR